MTHDEMEEEVVQTQSTSESVVPGTETQILVQTTPVRSVGAQSTLTMQKTPSSSPSSPTSPDITLASFLPRKTRSLCDIYNVDTTNSFSFFSLFSKTDDPLTFEEVVKDDVWEQAMDEEIRCIENDQTQKLVDAHEDKDVISVEWIYKTKQDAKGNVQKHKARLFAMGFTQQPGIDFSETFCVSCTHEQVRIMFSLLHKTSVMFIKWM
jgi:hypothetical protein